MPRVLIPSSAGPFLGHFFSQVSHLLVVAFLPPQTQGKEYTASKLKTKVYCTPRLRNVAVSLLT